MGILLIIAALAAWEGLARVLCKCVIGRYRYGNLVDVICSHFASACSLFGVLMIVMHTPLLCSINWHAVWHGLLYLK